MTSTTFSPQMPLSQLLLFLLALLLLITITVANGSNESHEEDSSEESYDYDKKEFDFLIFTQRWPETTCLAWKMHNHANQCTFPNNRMAWTVHGIWPTKNGTMGPFFCDESRPFRLEQVRDIVPQLQQMWTNVEKGTAEEGLWRHEWEKHGTCAAQLEPLNTEEKYFNQGLLWLRQYSMADILARATIVPDQTFSAFQLNDAVYRALGKHPVYECERKEGKQYLMEIRICFDKQLQLRDCDGAIGVNSDKYKIYHAFISNTKLITNCDLNELIEYQQQQLDPTRVYIGSFSFSVVKLYRLIRFLQWVTL